jgi:hypothetical protein
MENVMRKFLVLLMTLAIVGGATLAQDATPVFCGDLPEADCTILQESAAVMSELSSAAFNFQLDFDLGGIPDIPVDNLSFRLTGDGAYALDSEALSLFSTQEWMQNLEELPAALESALKAISADATLVLFFPPEIIAAASEDGTDLPDKVGLSLRLVDGVGYVNLDKLADLDRSGDMPRGWIGLDIATALSTVLSEADLGSMSTTMPGFDPEAMSIYSDPAMWSRFVTVTRLEDTEIDGQTAAVFQDTINLAELYADPEFQAIMREQLETTFESMGTNDSGFTDENFDQLMEFYAKLFEDLSLVSTKAVGLDDHYVHQTTMAMDWTLDLAEAVAQFGETSSSDAPTITFNMDFESGLSQFNDAPAITAPEDATIIPLDEVFGPRFNDMSRLFAQAG